MEVPTASELLLAAEIRRRAIAVRKAEITAAAKDDPEGRSFEDIEASWEKAWPEYIATITDELRRIWDTTREHLSKSA